MPDLPAYHRIGRVKGLDPFQERVLLKFYDPVQGEIQEWWFLVELLKYADGVPCALLFPLEPVLSF